jgi:polyisoprenoid-binding protein YceI
MKVTLAPNKFLCASLLSTSLFLAGCEEQKAPPPSNTTATTPSTQASNATTTSGATAAATTTTAPAATVASNVQIAQPPYAEPATYELDPPHTRVGFGVKHLLVTTVKGNFKKFTGKINIDEKDLSKTSLDIEVDVNSIDTGEPKRDDHLRSDDFFGAKTNPKMTFKSKSVERGAAGYLVTGDLTMHGVTKPVTLTVDTLSPELPTPFGTILRGAHATGKVSRKDFGMKFDNKIANGAAVVADEVAIEIEAELKRPEPKTDAGAPAASGAASGTAAPKATAAPAATATKK